MSERANGHKITAITLDISGLSCSVDTIRQDNPRKNMTTVTRVLLCGVLLAATTYFVEGSS
jgi:hypothetical protein